MKLSIRSVYAIVLLAVLSSRIDGFDPNLKHPRRQRSTGAKSRKFASSRKFISASASNFVVGQQWQQDQISNTVKPADAIVKIVSGDIIQKNRAKSRNIARNEKIMDLGRKGEWKQLLALYHEEKREYDHINFSTTLSQLRSTYQKKKIGDEMTTNPHFVAFVDNLAWCLRTKGVDWIGYKGIATIVHSIGSMGLKSRSARNILDFAVSHRQQIMEKACPQSISNICWGFAKLKFYKSKDLFLKELDDADLAARLIKHGSTQNYANIVWACAKTKVPCPNILDSINTSWLFEKGSPRDVSNIVWACGALKYEPSTFFKEVDDHASWLVEHGNSQDIANTAWALAIFKASSPNLSREIKKDWKCLKRLGRPKEIASMEWALPILAGQITT